LLDLGNRVVKLLSRAHACLLPLSEAYYIESELHRSLFASTGYLALADLDKHKMMGYSF